MFMLSLFAFLLAVESVRSNVSANYCHSCSYHKTSIFIHLVKTVVIFIVITQVVKCDKIYGGDWRCLKMGSNFFSFLTANRCKRSGYRRYETCGPKVTNVVLLCSYYLFS